MIKIKMIGGLGNQFFQYATAKSLALRLNTPLCLNVDFYNKRNARLPRDFELAKFPNCMEGVVIEDRALSSKLGETSSQPLNLYKEKDFSFDPNVKNLPDNSSLSGYFQSNKYFDEIKDTLRKYFLIPLEYSQNKELNHKMNLSDSIAMHIRRGDYVHDEEVAAVHVSQSVEYYLEAFEFMKAKLNNPAVYVFSDDIAWAKENIFLSAPTTFIDHNIGPNSHLDFVLMAQAKHHIISNSSFSWWAAYLSKNDQGYKIAPSKWFHNNSMSISDLLPDSWIRM
jgi:hypothetical protein